VGVFYFDGKSAFIELKCENKKKKLSFYFFKMDFKTPSQEWNRRPPHSFTETILRQQGYDPRGNNDMS
jgi:hypothetical protein